MFWNKYVTINLLQPINMLCTAQLDGPVLQASGRVQINPFQLGDKSHKITDQHTAGRAISKLIEPTRQALTLINPFHKRYYCIILPLQ